MALFTNVFIILLGALFIAIGFNDYKKLISPDTSKTRENESLLNKKLTRSKLMFVGGVIMISCQILILLTAP